MVLILNFTDTLDYSKGKAETMEDANQLGKTPDSESEGMLLVAWLFLHVHH